MHCIFSLGLGVVAQGYKQALVGKEVVNYGPGQSMLASIDLPVISHVTRASIEEPMLGLMLTLDSRDIVKTAAEMQLPAPPRTPAFTPITIETLDDALIGFLIRLIELLGQPALAPQLAPLFQQEIIVRLLAGPTVRSYSTLQPTHRRANRSPGP